MHLRIKIKIDKIAIWCDASIYIIEMLLSNIFDVLDKFLIYLERFKIKDTYFNIIFNLLVYWTMNNWRMDYILIIRKHSRGLF